MSGHSKWSTIKRKKGATDAKRGQVFTRLSKEISVAARSGGDPETNFRLRLAVERARAANMPKDNIKRAIKKGTGEEKGGTVLEQVTYEGYAQHGVALMIETVTDNRNRAVAELRHILAKSGGNLGETGSVTWQFENVAYFAFPPSTHSEEELFDLVVDAGAEDLTFSEEIVEVFASVESFKSVSDALQVANISPDEAMLRMEPKNMVELSPSETAQVMKTIESVEELDDVQNVYTNLEVTTDALTLYAGD
ncbi:MAG: YebC/PmpR family DNA-binding transcriptional regulator [Anaerolineales bacterium]